MRSQIEWFTFILSNIDSQNGQTALAIARGMGHVHMGVVELLESCTTVSTL